MHRRTLERHRKDGCPWPSDGADLAAWAKNLQAWVAARRKRPPRREPGTVDALERSREMLADIREIERDKLRGLLIEREAVAEEWRRRVLAVRAKLLALPRLLAGRCKDSPPELIEAEASSAVRDMLEEFAAGGDLTPPTHE